MFERYTEKARRVVFFARYEASQFGSTAIESEHMLLGLLREDRPMVVSFMHFPDSVQGIRREIEERSTALPKISTSIDLPLTSDCKRALAYAAEEAERLGHSSISTEHLLLGLLRIETSVAAKILLKRGVDITAARERLAKKKPEEFHHEPGSRLIASAVPVFRVVNVAKSLAWYRDMLGFAGEAAGDPADPTFASLSRDDVEIMLQKIRSDAGESRSATKAGGGWDVYIRVHDIRAFATSIQPKLPAPVSITETEYGCLEFLLTDPDGHVIVFGECN